MIAAVAILAQVALSVVSPDGRNEVELSVGEKLSWRTVRDAQVVVEPSRLGLSFVRQKPIGALRVVEKRQCEIDTVWTNRFGGNSVVRDYANELTLTLEEVGEPKRRLGIVARAYDEGVAFRYVIPRQAAFHAFSVDGELTEFRFPGNPLAWLSVYDRYDNSHEALVSRRSLQSVDEKLLVGFPAVVELPTCRAAVCEAALSKWAGMFLTVPRTQKPRSATAFAVALSPAPGAARSGMTAGVAPAVSPWRVVMLADDDVGLVRCRDLMLSLNPPPEGGDAAFDWVEPGVTGWDWWVNSNNDFSKERIMKGIDFAAEMGWKYQTVDGGWYGRPAGDPGTVMEPLPEWDLPACFAHAKEKGVGLILWAHWAVLEQNGVDETFAKFARWGAKGVKIDFLNRQDREMVDWCEKVCRLAAKHRLIVNFHGAIKPTGTERTWPNQLTREAILGNESSKWEDPTDALNAATLPMTRFLIGPGDYTPGGFDNVFARDFVAQMDRGHRYADMSPESRAMKIYAQEIGTRGHALALCVAFDSPLMTLCDWPERYRGAAGVEALRNLPTVWRRTIPLAGRIGEFYAVAREAFDGRFYVAVETVEPRKLDVKLDFLGEGKWTARLFADDPAKTPKDANALLERTMTVTRDGRLTFDCCGEGGGVAILSGPR